MCGIAGILTTASGVQESLDILASRMALAIQHRGPDDAGAWADAQAGIALGHRRLSIVDLSPAGHQPMHSAGERFVLAFNGEIYNHLDLRAELGAAGAAPAWRGHSDTETLLAAFEQWGLEATLQAHGRHVRHCAVGSARTHACTWRATALAKSRCITAG